MSEGFCKKCAAPLNGSVCKFCGYDEREERVSAAVSPKRTTQAVDKEESANSFDMLSDKADFLDADGQVKLGLLYLNGLGIAKNERKAAELFHKGALGGSRDGMFRYAEALRLGQGVPEDHKRAMYYYVQAAKLGHCGARNTLKEFSDGELDIVPDEKVKCGYNNGFEQVVERVRPYCVEITCFDGKVPVSQGSGCILSDDIVLTNAHVVMNPNKEGDTEDCISDLIFVNLDKKYSDRPYRIAPVAVDPNEDVALCAFVDQRPELQGEAPQLASCSDLTVGKEVFTIGNGLGRGLGLSRGVISRDVEKGAYGHREVIRTDMSVNPGNSGGALFDTEGNVLGVMTFVAQQKNNEIAYGMSYAITSDTVVRLLGKLIEG